MKFPNSDISAHILSLFIKLIRSKRTLFFCFFVLIFSSLPPTSNGLENKSLKTSFSAVGHPLKFISGKTDYVLYNCSNKLLKLKFSNYSKNDTVNGNKLYSSIFSKFLSENELITIKLFKDKKSYFIRCLPDNFPILDLKILKSDYQQNGYFLLPYSNYNQSDRQITESYDIITDKNGTPIWYEKLDTPSVSLKYSGNKSIFSQSKFNITTKKTTLKWYSFLDKKRSEILLDGRQDIPVTLLPNGNIIAVSTPKIEINPSSLAMKNVEDFTNGNCSLDSALKNTYSMTISEFSPNGSLIWEWDASEHIDYTDVSSISLNQYTQLGQLHECFIDIFSPNHISKSEDQNGYLLSLKWGGLLYIDSKNGDVLWKLGGPQSKKSLAISGDPLGTKGPIAQNGGYMTSDSRILIFDNQVSNQVLARAVEYYIDAINFSATYIRSYTLGSDFCVSRGGSLSCTVKEGGRAEYLSNKNILVSWGTTLGRNILASIFSFDGRELATLSSRSEYPNVRAITYVSGDSFNISDLRLAVMKQKK